MFDITDPFKGPRLKLSRADHHLVEIKRLEREFFESNPAGIIFDTDSQPGHKLAKVVIKSKPPELLHVFTGELIYQLRSALDQTAVALARLSAGPTKPKRVHYPSGDGFKGFVSSCRSNLRHFDPDLRKLIMSTRPYDGGNEILRSVFRMANIDKHMDLIAVGSSGGITGISSFTFENGHTGLILSGPGNLDEGVVFSDLTPAGTITPNHPNAKIYISGEITLGDIAPYQRRPLVPFLAQMIGEVRKVTASVRDLCVASGRIPDKPTAPTSSCGAYSGRVLWGSDFDQRVRCTWGPARV